MTTVQQFRVLNLPLSVSRSQAHNLLWLVPGLVNFDIQDDGPDERRLFVNIMGLQQAEYFCRILHGRPFDTEDPNAKQMLVVPMAQATLPVGFQAVADNPSEQTTAAWSDATAERYDSSSKRSRRDEPRYGELQPTLYGRGFSADESSSRIRDLIESQRLDGMCDVRPVLRRRSNTGMVFVDFDTMEQARVALRRLRDGIEFRTGLCTFSMSEPTRY